MNIILHPRERHLLAYLYSKQDFISSKMLAKELQVSDRTIRNYVIHVNQALKSYDIAIDSKHGKGYILRCENDNHQVIQQLFFPALSFQTRNDRVFHLLLRAISADSHLDLYAMEDEMFISRSTLESDVRQLIEQYEKKSPFLSFSRSGHYLLVEDNERKKRVALNKAFSNQLDTNFCLDAYSQSSFFGAGKLDVILENVKSIMARYHFKMDDRNIVETALSIAIAEIRINEGHERKEPEYESVDPEIMHITNELLDSLEPFLETQFSLVERKCIAFAIRKRELPIQGTIKKSELIHYISPKCLNLVECTLQEICRIFDLDLMEDEYLWSDLSSRMTVMINRLSFFHERKSSILPTLINNYPFAMDMACLSVRFLKEIFKLEPEENELSYIAACINEAVERKMTQRFSTSGIPVAFVSHLNYSSSQFILMQLKSLFGSAIDFKGPFSVFDAAGLLSSSPCFICTTTRRSEINCGDIPVVCLSLPLDNKCYGDIIHAAISANRNMIYPVPTISMDEVFSESLFFKDMTFTSLKDAIAFLSESLMLNGCAGPEFFNAIIERETVAPTVFDCGIATPHSLYPIAKKTAVAVAIMSRPLFLRGQPVHCIIVPAITPSSQNCLGIIWNRIISLRANPHKLNSLINATTFGEFIKNITD